MKTVRKMKVPGTELAIGNKGNRSAMHPRIGFLKRLELAIDASHVAGEALKVVQLEQVQRSLEILSTRKHGDPSWN